MTTSGIRPASTLQVLDFHAHYVPPTLARNTFHNAPSIQRQFWEQVHTRLVDAGGIVPAMDAAGVDMRALSCSPEFLWQQEGCLRADDVERANDALAAVVASAPDRLCGMAVVDGYAGDAGARQLTRAVRDLGMRGVFFESARGHLLPDAPQARATLVQAANLGIPVFLHPVPDLALKHRFVGCRTVGERLVRGTVNSAAVISMVESGLFEPGRPPKFPHPWPPQTPPPELIGRGS